MSIEGRQLISLLSSTERAKVRHVKVLVACILGTALILAAAQTSWVSSFVAPLIIIVGIAVLFMALRNWELGVQAVLVIVVFEGAVRKWFLPSASDLVYFYKDFVMLASFIGYLSRRDKTPLVIKGRLQLLAVIIFAFLAYALASVSNPREPHFLVGLLGVKVYCLYMSLAFMVPRMFSSKQKLIGFLKWYVLLAVPVIALGVTQFRNGDQTSSLNRYAWNQEAVESDIAGAGIAAFQDSEGNTYVRVTGTFSYLSGLAIYLPVVFGMLLGLLSSTVSRHTPRLLRWLYYLALGVVVATTFMTGSRGAVLNLAVIVLIFFALTSLKSLKDRLLQIVVGGILAYVALTVIFPQALDAMATRAFGGEEQVEEGQGRIDKLFRLPFDESVFSGAFGYGIGATQNSVPSLMEKLNLPFTGERIPIGYEEESARVMLDLGVVGYLLYGLLRFILLITLWRSCLAIRDRNAKSIAVAALSILTIHIFVGGAIVNHTQNVYQWFLVGVCFALLNAEKLRQTELNFDPSIKVPIGKPALASQQF